MFSNPYFQYILIYYDLVYRLKSSFFVILNHCPELVPVSSQGLSLLS